MQRWIPIKADPRGPDDGHDGNRIALVRDRWMSQDMALLARDREIEENIRMLCGRHWDVYSELLGRFVDISRFMSEDERRWRQRPVIDRLLKWFILTHARFTESNPIITFQPATADRKDALLAEVMDTLFKTKWREVGMEEVVLDLFAWLIPAGGAYLKSRVDYTKGALVTLGGPAMMTAQDPQVGEIERYIGYAPYDNTGNPIGSLVPAGDDPYGGYALPDGYQPQQEHRGELAVDALSPMECRGEWGNKPWHKKRWHIHRGFYTPEEVYDRWGVDVEPDTFGDEQSGTVGYLTQLLFGAGYFGAASGKLDSGNTRSAAASGSNSRRDGYVCVDEMWEAPCKYSPETEEDAGGRLTAVTRTKCLSDSTRPWRLKYTSPIRFFQFASVPGRPGGTTPLERMKMVQKAYNRGWQQILDHRALMTNPVIEYDLASGLNEKQFVSRPGMMVGVNKRPGVEAFRFVAPPAMPTDVWRVQDQLANELDDQGNIPGAEGSPPTSDASGDLVQELRFNSDRFVGPTAKRAVIEFSRMAEDWKSMLETIMTDEEVLEYTGEDQIPRTIYVMPEMWEGKVHAFPDLESMLPEGRGERQVRVEKMYAQGAFGPPGSPDAVRRYLELSRFPHLGRAALPGGIDRVTARQNIGKLIMGVPETEVPVFPWYRLDVHLQVTNEYMSSPEYLDLDQPTQIQLVLHRDKIRQASILQMALQLPIDMQVLQMAMAQAGGMAGPSLDGAPSAPALPAGGEAGEPSDTPQ